MKTQRQRRPNRIHLLPVILDMVKNRTWFSARQIAHAVYYGRGVPHATQLITVRKRLDLYVQEGVLIRDDEVAACPFYGFADCYFVRPKGDLLVYYLYFWPPNWSEENRSALIAAYEDLDRFLPRSPDRRLYLPDGRLRVPPPPASLAGPDTPFPWQKLPEPGCTWLTGKRAWRLWIERWLPFVIRPCRPSPGSA